MQKEQELTVDPEGLKRIQDMIKGTVKPVQPPARSYQMPKGDTITVAKMKKEIAAKKASKEKPIGNPEVANAEPSIGNHIGNPEVAQNTKNIGYIQPLREVYLKDIDLSLIKVLGNQLSDEQQEATLLKLQQRCQAEGVSMPTGVDLIESLLVLQADSL